MEHLFGVLPACQRAVSSGLVAGNGTSGYGGDGGPATSAALNFPTDIALDAAGNLYIADYENNCIRKVTTSGGNQHSRRQRGQAGIAVMAVQPRPPRFTNRRVW